MLLFSFFPLIFLNGKLVIYFDKTRNFEQQKNSTEFCFLIFIHLFLFLRHCCLLYSIFCPFSAKKNNKFTHYREAKSEIATWFFKSVVLFVHTHIHIRVVRKSPNKKLVNFCCFKRKKLKLLNSHAHVFNKIKNKKEKQ